jgi:hypothetical protein
MNTKKLLYYQIFSTFIAILLGALLHFTYNLSDQNSIVALFSSINESVWEHLKLVFFPMVITMLIGIIYFNNNYSNFLCSKTIGIIVSSLFVIIFFYTYTGIIGTNIAIIDISSFLIAIILGEYISYKLILQKFNCNNKLAFVVLLSLFICFFVFTYYTPNIGLFKDYLTGQYGIIGKYIL